MKVDLINLGENPRVFYDLRQQPVVLGIGKIVKGADMGDKTLQSLERFKDTETVLVAPAGEGTIPEELQKTVDLLAVVDFEDYNSLLVRFRDIVPIDDPTAMRPTRIQMRVQLRAKVDEFIAAHRQTHDDVDPKELQRELDDKVPEPRQAPAPKPRSQRNR